ncbi:hypothetical protein P9272_33630 [Mesorhizobium sp. WSM4976]|uniref:hypothetical protein n=1 Tax=Mesorhizobium sp. WSM4976 TaxID=3038549 RepID=UPI002416E397|nr:hypothetical protein [Mesorhizobium sp. WSM4976]MDG4898470.1 hypothetical protein [Mesorhizobium sp. WSM4976]
MYQKTDELVDRYRNRRKQTQRRYEWVKAVTAGVTRWKLIGLGSPWGNWNGDGGSGSLVRVYWSDIWRVLRGG